MTEKEDCYFLGKIIKTTGFTGQVMIGSAQELPDEIQDFAFFHIEIDGQLIPFFIKNLEWVSTKHLRVSFLDAPTQEKARTLVDSNVYIEKKLSDDLGLPAFGNDIKEYRVTDKFLGHLGIVVTIMQHPGQDLIVVHSSGKEILIPMVEGIIIKVDHDEKMITVDLPDGLVDLNP